MSREEFRGRPVVAGEAEGEAVVSRSGLNWLATYQKTIVSRTKKAVGADKNNPDIYGKDLTHKILVIPQGIGSTTGGLVIAEIACMRLEPKAILCTRQADTLTVSGVLLANNWFNSKIILVDQLGEEVLKRISTGDRIKVYPDGRVEVLGKHSV
ncbi:MAG: aconitase X swivel domain-containing protein [Infirmifilum sp.]